MASKSWSIIDVELEWSVSNNYAFTKQVVQLDSEVVHLYLVWKYPISFDFVS